MALKHVSGPFKPFERLIKENLRGGLSYSDGAFLLARGKVMRLHWTGFHPICV